LLPGLADHHIYPRSLAAAARSVDLRGAPVESALPAPGEDVLRVIGAPSGLTRADLDRLWPERPVRVQQRSGALWTLNSAALALVSAQLTPAERVIGQFWRDASRARVHLPAVGPPPSLAAAGARPAAFGLTHVTDATPGLAAALTGLPQHALSLAADGDGPLKVGIPDHEPPDYAVLLATVRAAHLAGRGVALHVTAVALAVAIAAITEAGAVPADRVEHAAVCDDQAAGQLARLGVTVVTQPSIFARHGRSYLAESEPGERPLLWRYGGLLRLGVRVALSSDAPHGDPSPWETVRAAVTRAPAEDAALPLGPPEERVEPLTALASLLAPLPDPAGPPRQLGPGSPADLCLLQGTLADELEAAAATGKANVVATFISGRLVHDGGLGHQAR
jgi:predicted amidohydrolase YtcJ